MLREFGRVLEIELVLNLLAVVLDGLDAQVQFLGDFTRFLPLPDELKDLQFTVAEAFNGRLLDVGFASNLLLQHLGTQRFTHVDISAQDAPDSGNDFVEGLLLHQVSEGTGAKSNFSVNGLIMRADNQDGHFSKLGFDIAHEFQTAAVFEGDIGDDQVGSELFDSGESLGGIFFLTAYNHVALAIDQLGNAIAHDGVVIDQQDSDSVVLYCGCFGLSHGNPVKLVCRTGQNGLRPPPGRGPCGDSDGTGNEAQSNLQFSDLGLGKWRAYLSIGSQTANRKSQIVNDRKSQIAASLTRVQSQLCSGYVTYAWMYFEE